MKASKAARLTLSHRQAQYIIESAKAFAEDSGREITPEELLSRMLSHDHMMAVGCDIVHETVVARENPRQAPEAFQPALAERGRLTKGGRQITQADIDAGKKASTIRKGTR